MHPILFRIPLPERPVDLFWLLMAAAGVMALITAWQLVKKAMGGAGTAGVVGVILAVLAFQYQGESWDMGPVPIYSYGVMLGLSLVVGWYLTLGLAERDGLPKETMANNYVVTAIAAVVGARLLYIFTNLDEFETFGQWFQMRRGGLVAYGGFIGGLLGSYFFLRHHKIPLLPWADVAVPSLASGLMITRIGCYMFGCDFGRPLKDDAPQVLKDLGTFPHWEIGTLQNGDGSPAWVQHVKQRGLDTAAEHSLPVHPTQLYESALGLALLILLLTLRKKQTFRGQIFLMFTFAYGFARFMLEMLRDDEERGWVPPSMSEHLLIPLSLAVFGVALAFGIAKMIDSTPARRVLQVLAFVPAVAAYIMLRPETFAGATTIQLSTSQAVGVASAVAAAIAFSIFHRSAIAHPEAAMALNLPPPPDAGEDDDDDDDDDSDDRSSRRGAGPKKAAPSKKAKSAATKASDDDDDSDDDDSDDDDSDDDDSDDDDSDDDDSDDDDSDDDDDDEPPPKPPAKKAPKPATKSTRKTATKSTKRGSKSK